MGVVDPIVTTVDTFIMGISRHEDIGETTNLDVRDSVVDVMSSGGWAAGMCNGVDDLSPGTFSVSGTKVTAHDSDWCTAMNQMGTVINSELHAIRCNYNDATGGGTLKIAGSLIEGSIGIGQGHVITNCWDQNFQPIIFP